MKDNNEVLQSALAFVSFRIAWMIIFTLSLTVFAYAQEELWEDMVDKSYKLYQQGKYSEATNTAKDALKVAKKTFGENHFTVAISLKNIAEIFREQGNYDEAASLYKQALAIDEKNLGNDHPLVISDLQNIAELYQKIKRKDKAKNFEIYPNVIISTSK